MDHKIEVRDSGIHGKGVFALEDIPKGILVIEYLGELIGPEEADRREDENDKIGLSYIFCLDDGMYLDGDIPENDAKYVNHSCDPNCDIVEEDNRIYYYANRLIKKGEELTIDYSYDKEIDKVVCRCKSPLCRGFINEI